MVDVWDCGYLDGILGNEAASDDEDYFDGYAIGHHDYIRLSGAS